MLNSAREKLSREGETKSLKEKRVGSPPGLRFLQREWPSTQGHPAPRDNFAFSHVNGSLLFIKKCIKSSVAWNGLTYLLSLLKDCNFTLNWPFKNEQRTGHEHIFSSVQTFNHLKDHPKISKFTKFDGYWFTPKGMVHLVWIGGTGVLQSILSPLILKVYHAFVFKPITIKFGKFTNFWMLFPMTCLVFNQIDTEGWYQEKICSYPLVFEMANFSNFSISQTKFPQGTEKRGEFCKFNIIGAISYTRHISSSPRFYCISKGN